MGGRRMTEGFFEERTDQSEVKARIVQKYFFAWANVMMSTAAQMDGRIAYIDLYAGPGRYKDGAASTPLMVLEKAIAHPKMCNMLVALLNDADPDHIDSLQSNISALSGSEKLKYKPEIRCGEVDEDFEDYFNSTNIIPSFSFIDPFGYKGLSLKIIKGVIKDFGCDCVFFFNYSRINAGVSNDIVEKHMRALFGEERLKTLTTRLPGLTPSLREALILEELANEIKSLGGNYVLPFTFKDKNGKRSKHKLVFVSKHFMGYKIMKDIMAKESSTKDQGVPTFTYSPADASMPLLFSLNKPFDKLLEELPIDLAGQSLTTKEIYENHSVDTPYIMKNYKDVLRILEEKGKIGVRNLRGTKRRRNSFADHLVVDFPEVG
jgi:three-Cys-motif partner protein